MIRDKKESIPKEENERLKNFKLWPYILKIREIHKKEQEMARKGLSIKMLNEIRKRDHVG